MTDNRDKNELQAVFVGAGNVGLQAILTFALVTREVEVPWRAWIVDFDSVEEKDVRKGFHHRMVGQFKAEAAVAMVSLLYGKQTASRFSHLISAAQSAPGLIREADAVFNGVDSTLDAAFVSEEARNTYEVRMSTGIVIGTAAHTLEVMPRGFTLGEISYDSAAWADAARHECKFGTSRNAFAGVSQPSGSVTAALAVQLVLSRDGKDVQPCLIRVTGGEIRQSFFDDTQGIVRESEEIPLSYDRGLSAVWDEVACRLGSAAEHVRLRLPAAFVTRQCSSPGHGGVYQGFERHPVWGLCPECGEKSYCLAAPRELSLREIEPLAAHLSLRELFAPAGLRFDGWTREGKSGSFHLPFRSEDVPPLPGRGRRSTPKAEKD